MPYNTIRNFGAVLDNPISGYLGQPLFVYNGAVDEGADIISGFVRGEDLIRVIGTASDVVSIVENIAIDGTTIATLSSGTEMKIYGLAFESPLGLDDFQFV